MQILWHQGHLLLFLLLEVFHCNDVLDAFVIFELDLLFAFAKQNSSHHLTIDRHHHPVFVVVANTCRWKEDGFIHGRFGQLTTYFT